MPLPVITAAFAGVFAILGVMLSLYVSFLRSRTGIEYGDGGEIVLTRAIRENVSFREHVPLALLLLLIAELLQTDPFILHGLAFVLLAARIWHTMGILFPDFRKLRTLGAILTHVVMGITAVILMSQAFL